MPESADLTNATSTDLINATSTDVTNATSTDLTNATSAESIIETVPEISEIEDTTFTLDGPDDYIVTTGSDTADVTEISISVWVMPEYGDGASSELAVVSSEDSFVLSVNNVIPPEKVATFSVYNGISWSSILGQTEVPGGIWTHLVAIIDSNQISLYQNGVLAASSQLDEVVTYPGGLDTSVYDQASESDSGIVIGAYVAGGSASDQFSGSIDSVTVFDKILTLSEISDLYETTEPAPVETDVSAGTSITDYTLTHDEIVVDQSVSWELQVSFSAATPKSGFELPEDATITYVEVINGNQNGTVLYDGSVENLNILSLAETQAILDQREILGNTDVFILGSELIVLASLQEVLGLLHARIR